MPALETILFDILTATADPAAVQPTPRQVTEAAALVGLLSDTDERWFRPAVTA